MNDEEILLEMETAREGSNMIVFSGVICEQARLDRMRRMNRIVIVPITVVGMIALLAIVLCFVYSVYDIAYGFIPILVADAICLFLVYRPNKSERLCYASYLSLHITITVSDGKIANSYFKKKLTVGTKSIQTVKRVIDVGEWYYIIFKFGDIGNSWVCQKDLLINGTIKEFEELFKDKIVRK